MKFRTSGVRLTVYNLFSAACARFTLARQDLVQRNAAAIHFHITQERCELERLRPGRRVSVRLAERAAIVLHAADGLENQEISEAMGISRQKAVRPHREIRLVDQFRCVPFTLTDRNDLVAEAIPNPISRWKPGAACNSINPCHQSRPPFWPVACRPGRWPSACRP